MIENLWMNIITYHKFDFRERKWEKSSFIFHSFFPTKVIYEFDKFNFIVGKPLWNLKDSLGRSIEAGAEKRIYSSPHVKIWIIRGFVMYVVFRSFYFIFSVVETLFLIKAFIICSKY